MALIRALTASGGGVSSYTEQSISCPEGTEVTKNIGFDADYVLVKTNAGNMYQFDTNVNPSNVIFYASNGTYSTTRTVGASNGYIKSVGSGQVIISNVSGSGWSSFDLYAFKF